MTRLILILILSALACGTPFAVTLPTQTGTQTAAPATSTIPATVPASWQVVHVTGCWNLRETAGGKLVPEPAQACNRDLSVTVTDTGGWFRSPLGWICGRAFGADVTCKLYVK